MGIEQVTKDGVEEVLAAKWVIAEARVVPATEDVVLKNGGKRIDATYAYADLAQSSWLAQEVGDEIVAKVIRVYLNAATRLLKYYGGEIRSFDGDRVMAIFIGSSKNTSAVKAAYALNWAVREVIRQRLQTKWPKSLSDYTMDHGVGIATGEALIVRGGVRNSNDLVSVGPSPNIAAKLSELRAAPDIYIAESVYANLNESVKKKLDGTTGIWVKQPSEVVGGNTITVYGTSYWRKPGK